MSRAGHLNQDTVEAYARGACQPEEAEALRVHVRDCEPCRRLFAALSHTHASAEPITERETAAVPSPVGDGETVGGKYRIERTLGAGGMGTVVLAWHLQLNQRVALKFMLPALVAEPQAVARFQREARAAVRLQSPHAGRVLDLDSLPSGAPFLVMEYLEGETLEQRLSRERSISVRQVVAWVRQALEAIGEAHGMGIVHRDLKPANLFLARRPDGSEVIKVLDFGIAKSTHPDIEKGLGTSSAQMMIGSPPYMAPEQIDHGSPIDARTDLWAVGVVLYQLLSGELPFNGVTVVEVMYAVQSRTPAPLAKLVPDAPAALCALVDRCLSKDPQHRPAAAGEVSRALDEIAAALELNQEPLPVVRRPALPRAALAASLLLALATVIALVFRGPTVEPTADPVGPEATEVTPPPRAQPLPTADAPATVDAPETGPLPPGDGVVPQVAPGPTARGPARAPTTAPRPKPARAPASPPSDSGTVTAPDDVFGERR